VAPGTQHLDQQHPDHDGAGQGGDSLVERLVRDLQPEPGACRATDGGDAEADLHAAHQSGALALLEVSHHDAHDEERFDPFAEGDQQGLQHFRPDYST
jgi:hypothetical protein